MTQEVKTTNDMKYTRKDFQSSVVPRWCPGCGCFVVFKGLTSTFPKLGIPKENFAVISGIGCSSRFPYYVDTYGFHTLHGRAMTVALGAQLTNPELSVWVITGDGDGLSIGGNHFIHLMRRNPNIKVILFNNQIYGLTKGQASPTTPIGKNTKSTPHGSLDHPFEPLSMAIASGATFAARVHDKDSTLVEEVLLEAGKHKGVAFIEVLLNCVIFSDGAFDAVTKKEVRAEKTVILKHGAPLLFGNDNQRGVKAQSDGFKIVELNGKHPEEAGVMVHDAKSEDSSLAYKLSLMKPENGPVPMGIFRQVEHSVFEEEVRQKEDEIANKLGRGDLNKLLYAGETWTIE